ncbi:MAG: hypothetical protein IPL65_07765 [Lewinellaceae bacterium]|nr:hypothetical protein [Lewinellaceae bacterium]
MKPWSEWGFLYHKGGYNFKKNLERMRFCYPLILIIVVFAGSCKVEPESPGEMLPSYANEVIPQDNHLILSELLFGSGSRYSGFYFSEESGLGGFYVVGDFNGAQASTGVSVGGSQFHEYYDPSLIKFDTDGNKLWEKHPGFIIHRMEVVPAGILSEKEIIILTGYDENESGFQDESPDRSRIMLYNEDGVFIDNFSTDFALNLADLKLVENKTGYAKIIGIGSAYKFFDNNMHPGFFEFNIIKNPLSIDSASFHTVDLIDPKWNHVMFMNLEIYDGDYIISGTQWHNNVYSKTHILRFNKSDYNNPLWWSTLANSKPIYHWSGGLVIDDDNAYVSGHFEDTNKGKANAIEYWNTGYLLAVDLENGSTLWQKSFSDSKLSDRAYNVKSIDGEIFVAGMISFVWYPDYTIGNGIIMRLNKHTGEIISKRTFGDVSNKTLFWSMLFQNNTLWAIGQRQNTNAQSQGLLVKLNKNDI